jgi:hypothetical protein
MIILSFNNLKNLNVSLQVGDGVYARRVDYQLVGGLPQAGFTATYTDDTTGANHYMGVLKKIDNLGNNQYELHIDNTVIGGGYQPLENDFIMFSKFSQGDSGVLGYYAEAKFVNDSKEKAELFAVSSEITINSN